MNKLCACFSFESAQHARRGTSRPTTNEVRQHAHSGRCGRSRKGRRGGGCSKRVGCGVRRPRTTGQRYRAFRLPGQIGADQTNISPGTWEIRTGNCVFLCAFKTRMMLTLYDYVLRHCCMLLSYLWSINSHLTQATTRGCLEWVNNVARVVFLLLSVYCFLHTLI